MRHRESLSFLAIVCDFIIIQNKEVNLKQYKAIKSDV